MWSFTCGPIRPPAWHPPPPTVHQQRRPHRSSAHNPVPTSQTTPRSSGPYGATDQAKRAWEPIVQGFALAYPDTNGLTRKEWLANLHPYLDRPVVDALATTDLQKVPAGYYAGYQLLKVADEAITVRITYQEGWALVLYLAATGHGAWTIVAFDADLDY